MKNTALILTALVLLTAVAIQAEPVRINSLGYTPDAMKTAAVVSDATEFRLRKAASGRVVMKGRLSEPQQKQEVGQTLRYADFSDFRKKGAYVVEIPGGGVSEVFRIGKEVYRMPFVTAMRAFYLWRCGMAVSADYGGQHYATEACHLQDGYLDYVDPGHAGQIRDGTGGWHDAGDFGKYTVNAGVTVAVLFYAWDHFKDRLEKLPLQLPETAPGFPEFLKEIKYETDFLLKMQYPDGSGRVSHKLTRRNFSGFVMPQEDQEKRFFTEWSSAATADFVGLMAMAYRFFKPYDAAYAAQCLAAARLSWEALEKYGRHDFVQGDFSTGGYQTGDSDDRLWAAVEMWESTGEAQFLADAEQRIAARWTPVDSDWDWGSVGNLGIYTYILSARDGRDAGLVGKIKEAVVADADRLVAHNLSDAYGRALDRYYWGCNGTVARQAVNLHVADLLSPNPAYRQTILRNAAYLFGYNYYNRSFVTGLGINPPMHPHDRRSGADGIEAPWPGYLVGGGHTSTDWVDSQDDYARNEIAINWQAGLVYLLAACL